MKKIKIKNFGPVSDAFIDLDKDFQVFIGAQASGKSTICKVIYFCRKIKDYLVDFLMDSSQFVENHPNEYLNNFFKSLTGNFMKYFGTTKHMNPFEIEYCFDHHYFHIRLNTDGYVRFFMDNDTRVKIKSLLVTTKKIYDTPNELDILENVKKLEVLKKQFTKISYEIFYDPMEIIYIPAGRSLLAIMSEQLHSFSFTDIDLLMQEFINLIRSLKSKFGTKLPEIVETYLKTVKGNIKNQNAIGQASSLIHKILKADYASEFDAEKIYFDKNHWVKLMYGSSGQQESLWILMLLFLIILEDKCSFVIIEEPEAHLFPIAQKDMMELIILTVNATASQVIVTTHSPYLLTSLNLLLYSSKIEKRGSKNTIIPRPFRIDTQDIGAYSVEHDSSHFQFSSLIDADTGLVDLAYIDQVSTITNDLMDRLIDWEGSDGM